jgi:hypothetical protein
MRFYFLPNDDNLLKTASQGGCGVTDSELKGVKTWQRELGYKFEFHLENHGPYVYIFPDGRNAGAKNMPRFSFGGGRKGKFDSDASLNASIRSDVEAVVSANYGLFESMHSRFYDLGGKKVEAMPQPKDDRSAQAWFRCPVCNWECSVQFTSQMEKLRQIKDSTIGGIHTTEYPSIPCGVKTCAFPMDMIEFVKRKDRYPANVVKYP